ncbi:MAG: superoxide dismutase [Chthoniobacterales bacterium]
MESLPRTILNLRNSFCLLLVAAVAVIFSEKASAGETKADGVFILPPLPYANDALQPYIDAKTMEIHHDKHHAGYVKKLNAALEGQKELAAQTLDELMVKLADVEDKDLQTALRNNGGGHWNHSFFWETLTPAEKSGAPSEKLTAAIEESFGSMDEMKKQLAAASGKRFGSGWVWLISQDGKLKIVSTPNQDNPLMVGIVEEIGTPILGLDVWEHAYYLNYQNRRGDYTDAWWNVVNWDKASKRFE